VWARTKKRRVLKRKAGTRRDAGRNGRKPWLRSRQRPEKRGKKREATITALYIGKGVTKGKKGGIGGKGAYQEIERRGRGRGIRPVARGKKSEYQPN